jgi:DNA-binding NarL/FixJ family response regulator
MLADDHVVVRQGLCALLNADGQFRIVGEARDGREGVEMALRLRPDVILMDIAMPLLNGLEATRQILAANPAAKIVVLSAHSEEMYVERLLAAGAVGFLEKQTSADDLGDAIRAVARGAVFVSPGLAKRITRTEDRSRDRNGRIKTDGNRLTAREGEVLQLIAEGKANKQVAATLGISIKTVEKHRQQLMDKLNIHDTAGLTRHAIAAGVIDCKALDLGPASAP